MKNRLFCLGDSFVDWPVPTNHWTTYLKAHFEVTKFGKFGADNYSIISQVGLLPSFNEGDRLIIVFSDPGRLPRRYYGERKLPYVNNPYMEPSYYEDEEFSKKLHLLRHDEGERWINGSRDVEIKFFKKLKHLLSSYNPIFFTWNSHFYKSTSDFVELIQVSSNADEGVGDKKDFHPGPLGCYSIYIKLHKLLNVNSPTVDFIPHIKKSI